MAIKQIFASVPYQDPAGNILAGGSLTLDLSQPTLAIGGGEIAPLRVDIVLNSSGTFSATNFWANDQLTPSGTTYRLRVYSSNGLLVADFGQQSIQGASPIDFSFLTPVSSSGGTVSYPNPALLTQFAGVPTGTCLVNQVAINTLTGDFYSCVGGAWIKVGPGGNPGTLVSPITSPNPLQFNVTTVFKGSPWYDVSAYGGRDSNPATAPQIPGITATINATSTSCALSAASTFKNGDGVTIFGAGATQAMSTPGAPTVTPSVAAAGTGTGIVVNGPTGGTTYNYKVVARDAAGGLTASSAAGTTTTGAASLGSQSVTITSQSRSGVVVTTLTAAPHGLTVGSMVYISGTSDPQNFEGWFVVSGSSDNTHFTYATGLADYAGATTSATGGTAAWFNCNHVSWGTVAGAFTYYIYGRTGAATTLLGVSKAGDTFWDDFGSPMMDTFVAPYFVPTTGPVTATSDNLTTTIVSGAGTTTLILANAAGTSVAGNTILFDNAPAFLAAATASQGNPPVYFPPGTFVINSYVSLNVPIAIAQVGDLWLNDTVQVAVNSKWIGDMIPRGVNAPSFGFEGHPTINVNRATPGIYGNAMNSTSFRGLTLLGSLNNSICMLLDGAEECTFEDMNFQTGDGNGTNDYMGMPLAIRPPNNFFNYFRSCLFSTGPAQVFAASATPTFFCHQCGKTTMDHIAASRRGFLFESAPAGAYLTIKHSRNQGGIMPYMMIYGSGGSLGGYILLTDIELDTSTHPLFSNLWQTSQSYVGELFIKGTNGPSSSVPTVTGAAVTLNVEAVFAPYGQNFKISNPDLGNFSGLGIFGVTFANLGTPSSGHFQYCPDCTIANPCAGGGTGAFAKRLNGIWVCN
jgi:hypothetical protein